MWGKGRGKGFLGVAVAIERSPPIAASGDDLAAGRTTEVLRSLHHVLCQHRRPSSSKHGRFGAAFAPIRLPLHTL